MNRPVEVVLGIVLRGQAWDLSPRLGENVDKSTDETQILISRRPDTAVYGGYWELPGGKIEPGETPTDALVREMEEELGIAVAPMRALKAVMHTYPHASVRLHPYLCTWESGQIQNLAVAEHRWVTPDELWGYQFPEANTPIVSQIIEILSQDPPQWPPCQA